MVGIPHPYTGEAVKAYVVASRPGRARTSWSRHCERNLARFKCPSAIEFVDVAAALGDRQGPQG